MPDYELKSTSGETISEEQISAFVGRLKGQALRPQDADYEAARRIWNASIDRHPGLIVRCQGAPDVIAAVNFARENSLLVAVKGGGHNVGGRAICDDGLVIDLSLMKGVYVEPNARTVLAQGGATLANVDAETVIHGLAVPLGVVSRTGAGGLTLGGGTGWLVRRFGLTCDNVISMQLVTAEGELLTASAEENQDLFWALRGGGGNFGVVTSFVYRAHPVGTVLGGLIAWPREKAREVLQFYREFTESAPEELGLYAGLIRTPDGLPIVAAIGCYSGDLEEGERVLQPLRAFGKPLLDAFQPMPFPQMQSMLDAGFPEGNYNYWKSNFLRELSDDVIDSFIEHANRAESPLTGSLIEFYGGAAGRVAPSDTAFAYRGARYNAVITAQWTDAGESQQHTAWARSFSGALQPFSSGTYLNFLDQEPDETVRAAFGQNYARLVEVKNRYDRTNFFRLNQNVRPTV